jgi:clan AA aspartic protease
MIVGKVTQRGAVIRFDVHGPNGRSRSITAMVDTGFNGYLTLPSHIIRSIELPLLDTDRIRLANDESVELQRYAAVVDWNGKDIPCYIHESQVIPLVGLGLLADHDLAIRVRRGGRVTITSIPQRDDVS